jgi:hypothetical protein
MTKPSIFTPLSIFGFLLQFGAFMTAGFLTSPPQQYRAVYVSWLGLAILIFACAIYAKAKGRSRWFCVLAILWVPGLIVLAYLKDKRPVIAAPPPLLIAKCAACGHELKPSLTFCEQCGQRVQ